MRTLGILLTLLIGTAAYAQEPPRISPDALPPGGTVLHILSDSENPPRIDVQLGVVNVTSRSMSYHLVYLPLLPPLPGTSFRPSRELPNALALTGTEIPQKPHTRPVMVVRAR